jgi:hypothetical protein
MFKRGAETDRGLRFGLSAILADPKTSSTSLNTTALRLSCQYGMVPVLSWGVI